MELGEIGRSNTLRYTGLASGVDTESIIKSMLALDSKRLEDTIQNVSDLKNKRLMWEEIDGKLSSFWLKMNDLRYQSKVIPNIAESSNEDILEVVSASISNKTEFAVNVTKLATNTSITGDNVLATVTGPYDNFTKLSEIDDYTGLKEGTFKISTLNNSNETNTKEITITKDMTISQFMTKINAIDGLTATYSNGKFKVEGDATLKDITFGSEEDTSNIKDVLKMGETELFNDGTNKVKVESSDLIYKNNLSNMGLDDGVHNITINNKTFSFVETDSIKDIINKINNDSDANVTVSYNENTSKLTITNDSSGSLNLSVYGDNDLMTALGLDSFSTAIGEKAEAQISYDGGATVAKTITSNENKVSYDGNVLKLKSGDAGNWTKVTIKQDSEATKKFVEGFVKEYNEVMEFLYKRYSEDKVEGKEQADMTLEEKQQGLLKKNTHLKKIMSDMRSIVYGTVSKGSGTKYDSLYDIGIGSGDTGLNLKNTRKGLLVIDEKKLNEIISTNSNDIFEMLSLNDDTNSKYGIGTKLRSYMREVTKFGGYLDDVALGSKSTLTVMLKRTMDSMQDQYRRINQKEKMYYKKYTEMEKAMSAMQQQQNYLANLMPQK